MEITNREIAAHFYLSVSSMEIARRYSSMAIEISHVKKILK